MMAERFPDFAFGGPCPSLYGFTRRHEGHIYDHILFCRDFYEEAGPLSVGYVCRCFNPNWQIYPVFCLGERVHMEKLLVERRSPAGVPAGIIRRYCHPRRASNRQGDRRVGKGPEGSHAPLTRGGYMGHKLQGQGSKSLLIGCAEPYIQRMTEEDQQALRIWMHDNRCLCPAPYQEALKTVPALLEFKPQRMAEKAENFL